MTKARAPLTFADAVTRAAGRITWTGAADATGKSERTVRAWSDPEMGRTPCIEDCLALDAAYVQAGGGEPPLLAVYQARLERLSAPPADATDLAKATAAAAKESGEAVAALVVACMPGAPIRDRMLAEREVAEAVEALHDVQRKLGCPGEVISMRGSCVMADDAGSTFDLPLAEDAKEAQLLPLLDAARARYGSAPAGSLQAEQASRMMLRCALFIRAEHVGDALARVDCEDLIGMRIRADQAVAKSLGR